MSQELGFPDYIKDFVLKFCYDLNKIILFALRLLYELKFIQPIGKITYLRKSWSENTVFQNKLKF